MSGTDVACGAISLCACYAVSGSSQRIKVSISSGALVSILLRACYAKSGTGLDYRVAFSGSELVYLPTSKAATQCPTISSYARATQCPVLTQRMRRRSPVNAGMALRAYNAMSGTDLGRNCIALRSAIRCPVLTSRRLLWAYARATRCPVLTQRMVLPGGCMAAFLPDYAERYDTPLSAMETPLSAMETPLKLPTELRYVPMKLYYVPTEVIPRGFRCLTML
eukprot:2146355-Rhodomonas_salina.1